MLNSFCKNAGMNRFVFPWNQIGQIVNYKFGNKLSPILLIKTLRKIFPCIIRRIFFNLSLDLNKKTCDKKLK